MGKVPPWLVSDGLWARIEPLLLVRQRRPRNPGRLPLDDRGCLQGTLTGPRLCAAIVDRLTFNGAIIEDRHRLPPPRRHPGTNRGTDQGRLTATVSGAMQDVVMEPSKTIQMLWNRMQARDWAGIGELLADDVMVEWPVSGERICGRENYVRINAEYPEGWSIKVLRILPSGNEVVSEVEVPHDTMGIHRVASFWTVHNGLITRGREYWTELGADPSPAWRAPYVERI